MHKTRDIGQIPVTERVSQLWLTVDEVLERIPMGRSWLWKQIEDGLFPAPYMWKGTPLWTQADVREWICRAADGTAQPKSGKGKAPITWDAVERLLREKAPAGFTNREIANMLNAEQSDTTMLTRLMAIAGVLSVFKPIRNGSGAPNFYTIAIDLKRGVAQ